MSPIIKSISVLTLILPLACRMQHSKQQARPVQTVAVITVQKATVRRTVQLLGTLEGEQQAMATSKVTGRVTQIVKREGSEVKEGEPIAYVINDIPGMDYKPGPVLAPISGTVGKVYVDVGQTVSPAAPVAVISNFSSMVKATALASDADMPFIKVGAPARIAVSALPDTTFVGKVSQVSPMVDPMSRSATAEISIPNPGRRLVPGMTVSVTLLAEERKDVVALPIAALFSDGSNRVVVVEEKTARYRSIVTGLVGDDMVEVTSGLNPGEKVATTGKERVREGETVNPVEAGQ